jgi:hypothetical protein
LISDADGAISRALIGIDANDVSIPGIVILNREGRVVFRQVARGKDDRLSATQVLAAADAHLGTRGPEITRPPTALDRPQLRLEAGAGRIREGDRWQATGVAALTVHVPLTRYLIAGTGFATEAREATASLLGSLGLRLPILGDIAAVQLSAVTGLPISAPGIYAGAQLGIWFAWTPRWALHLDLGAGAHDTGSPVDQRPAWFATFGFSRLLAR